MVLGTGQSVKVVCRNVSSRIAITESSVWKLGFVRGKPQGSWSVRGSPVV